MTNKELADLIFPNAKDTEYYEKLYPERDLPEGAVVTRFAPSPTGYVHIGGLLQCVIEKSLVKQHGGVLMLRIEDTDQKRRVENGVEQIVSDLRDFDIEFDEGMLSYTESVGAYGPYIQSARKDIYDAYVKHLIAQGRAYPCFATEEELEAIREKQKAEKATPGYYGEWAMYRDLSADEAAARIRNGEEYVIRFRSEGDGEEEVVLHDLIRGDITFKRNEMDIVIMKNDGLPTYHFAHAVDDHLMHTTHVIRSDEWVSSAPIHLELFEALGFKLPNYCHYSPMLKEEDGKKRKISKRKDPEAAVSYYHEAGMPNEAVKEYLMGVANSDFEEWRTANPDLDLFDFPFSLDKMSISGALFDMDKLLSIIKETVCRMDANSVYDGWLAWCREYDPLFTGLLEKYPERSVAALNVGKGGAKPRKDIESWAQACKFMSFYYDETFHIEDDMGEQADEETRKQFFAKYLDTYDHNDDSAAWFDKVKAITAELGFAVRPKDYKKEPDSYKGSIVHITNMLRIALTGRANAPDIHEVSHVLGEEIVRERLGKWA